MKVIIPCLVLAALALTGCSGGPRSDAPLVYATQEALPQPTPTVEARPITVTPPSSTSQPTHDGPAAWKSCLRAARVSAPATANNATILPYTPTDLTTGADGVEIVSIHGAETGHPDTVYEWRCSVTGPQESPITRYLSGN